MKLLSKQQTASAISESRKLDIDQGAALAKKVDVLRETALKEQANLNKFRDEAMKQLRSDIGVLIEQKSKLERDVADLEQKKLLILRALNEWERITNLI